MTFMTHGARFHRAATCVARVRATAAVPSLPRFTSSVREPKTASKAKGSAKKKKIWDQLIDQLISIVILIDIVIMYGDHL